MDELVKLIDVNLSYVAHTMNGERVEIDVISARDEAVCPYCGSASKRVHSHYERRFLDLPIQGKKVEIILTNRKMFCDNADCGHKTFAEVFGFLPRKAKRSKRLTEEIVRVSLEVSSVTASRLLRENIADVSKSTICELLKKRNAGD